MRARLVELMAVAMVLMAVTVLLKLAPVVAASAQGFGEPRRSSIERSQAEAAAEGAQTLAASTATRRIGSITSPGVTRGTTASRR